MDDVMLYARVHEETKSMQTLQEHLDNVAKLAEGFCAVFDSHKWGELLGKVHDIGKAKKEFQEKLLKNHNLRVDHSGAGAVLLADHFEDIEGIGYLLAFAAAGHHSGLPDSVRLNERLTENRKNLSDIEHFVETLLDVNYSKFTLPSWLRAEKFSDKDKKDRCRSLEFWVRFIFSALVDADRLDAERFDLFAGKHGEAEVISPREVRIGIPELVIRLDKFLDLKMSALSEDDKGREVNIARAKVLEACNKTANMPGGCFSLTVPTGGGKTLSSMSFALRHAEKNNLKRVICVIPYTSIIEQNAYVYREAVGEENVLEHHCNYDVEKSRERFGEETADRFERAAENWDFPVIVTTTVQFFESLFANGGSKCRKLHNIARSVIILDEAQSLPRDLLSTLLEGLRELTDNYGCTLVISTATQPAFETRKTFRGLGNIREIMSEPVSLKRVNYHWPNLDEKLSCWDELAERILRHKRVLVVTHRRKDARDLARKLQTADDGVPLYHLSAQMCPAHRFEILGKISELMKDKKAPCRLVSTQLIEAGVDLDFDVVYRALGGLDSIVQSAGRCNREGREKLGDVYIYRFTEPPQGVLMQGAEICLEMIESAKLSGVELDLEDPAIFKTYFRKLYLTKGAEQISPLRERFHYKEVDSLMKLIDEDGGKSVVVQYGDSEKYLEKLKKYGWNKELSRKLQLYTVHVRGNDFRELCARGFVDVESYDRLNVLSQFCKKSGYDDFLGLLPADEIKSDVDYFIG
jgi:CRISPR-associated helicase Cas3/CRISPR-associated endonuclease Cas3-HD